MFSPQRHFCVFALSFPGANALATIYRSIISQHLKFIEAPPFLHKQALTLVTAALDLHRKVAQTFLPTAIKFHYVFNLRDLSNIFQVCQPCIQKSDLCIYVEKR